MSQLQEDVVVPESNYPRQTKIGAWIGPIGLPLVQAGAEDV